MPDMKNELFLNGEWRLTGTDETGRPIEVPIQIPGYVHPALEAAGLLPPIFWRDNARRCQWIEKREWTFARTFEVPQGIELSRAELYFGGIDTYADIYLNGKHIGSSKNMFVPLRLKVGSTLEYGRNTVKVVIHPHLTMLQGKPMDCPAAFDSPRVHVRRVQCTFFWDWVERFVSAGLWKEVKLIFPAVATLQDLFVFTQDIAPTSASLQLEVRTAGAAKGNCRFAVDIVSPNGTTVWNTSGCVFDDRIRLQADLPDAQLWWPNGYGEQPLYQVTARLFAQDGELIDRRTLRTGIRTVRLECLRDRPASPEAIRTAQMRKLYRQEDNPHPGESFILLVNGRRIYCKGANWVPPTPFPGTLPPGHVENLVRLAAQGGMNFLRVWGGGEYETDEFYDCCDQAGIMLAQDFMLSCADYPEEDPEFMENFRNEVRENVIALRNHCCIAVWNGNNENYDGFEWDDPCMKDRLILSKVLEPLLLELDPSRPLRPGSPWGGLKNGDPTVGDCHDSWWWTGAEKITPEHFSKVPRFASESPTGGYPMPSILHKFLCNSDLDNPDQEILEYHIKNNDFFLKLGWPTVHGRLIRNTEVILGKADSPRQTIFHRAFLQYEWNRMVIEGMRRAKWYNSGVLFWMYNDCWPALGYAQVDFYGRPKAGWFACRRAFAPIAATIAQQDGSLVFTILNDATKPVEITAQVMEADTLTGVVKGGQKWTIHVEPGENLEIQKAPAPSVVEHTLFFLELRQGAILVDRARWCQGWLAELKCTPARLSWRREDDTITVHCHEGIALGVAFDGDFVADDNYFDLLPGETRTLALRPPAGTAATGPEVAPYAYRGVFDSNTSAS